MIEFINFYYNLNVKKLHLFNNNIVFEKDDKEYIVCEVIDKELFKNMLIFLNNGNYFYHMPLINKDGELFSIYDGLNYVILEINGKKDDIVELFNYSLKGSYFSNWGNLWEQRSDYYRLQLNDYSDDLMLFSFMNYYLGLTEIAIANYNIVVENFNLSNSIYSISHKKIYYPNYNIDYYNPCNIIIDYNVRDLAEFIKYAFFYSNISLNEIIELISRVELNDLMANLLIVRLFYPSYFFEKYDLFVLNKISSNDLIDITKKSKSFEDLLINIYNYLNSNFRIVISSYLI